MYRHHLETIKNITDKLKVQEEVQAIIIGGSIAHQLETEKSDVDILVVISDDEYKKRKEAGLTHFVERESCTYEEGYIDGKYINLEFLEKVASYGSEAARFAFDGAWATYSKTDDIKLLIKQIVRYPVEKKQETINRFYAQFKAWNWYCYEAINHDNRYLLNHSVSNLVLFGGRMILAHNEVLYPYHKWFLRVLEGVKEKPENLMENIHQLIENPTVDHIKSFYECILNFRDWNVADLNWQSIFIRDSEQNWMDGWTPVADI
ncbi:MAG: nucleotidyltransferase domain-containing protein [Clostridia bacterium]|nr:nucleotidyltransferase domain-containing protein [Clostridia bacterium]